MVQVDKSNSSNSYSEVRMNQRNLLMTMLDEIDDAQHLSAPVMKISKFCWEHRISPNTNHHLGIGDIAQDKLIVAKLNQLGFRSLKHLIDMREKSNAEIAQSLVHQLGEVTDTGQKTSSIQDTHKIARLFIGKPVWLLQTKGDSLLWDDMLQQLATKDIPSSKEEFSQILSDTFKQITGLSDFNLTRTPVDGLYQKHGLSGAYICNNWPGILNLLASRHPERMSNEIALKILPQKIGPLLSVKPDLPLRGDHGLWDQMYFKLKSTALPATQDEYRILLHNTFKTLTGLQEFNTESTFCNNFDQGYGISNGVISAHWETRLEQLVAAYPLST